jgi:hypothetical protein
MAALSAKACIKTSPVSTCCERRPTVHPRLCYVQVSDSLTCTITATRLSLLYFRDCRKSFMPGTSCGGFTCATACTAMCRIWHERECRCGRTQGKHCRRRPVVPAVRRNRPASCADRSILTGCAERVIIARCEDVDALEQYVLVHRRNHCCSAALLHSQHLHIRCHRQADDRWKMTHWRDVRAHTIGN